MQFQDALVALCDEPLGTVMMRRNNNCKRFRLAASFFEPSGQPVVRFLTTEPTPFDFFCDDWVLES